MADLDFYKEALGVDSTDKLCQALCDTLIKTNRTYAFWVDWIKVARNSDEYRYQLALLASLHASPNPRSDLRKLLKRYPEVASTFPRLLAEHDKRLTVLAANEEPFEYVDIDFSSHDTSKERISTLVTFAEKTGLLQLLCEVSQPQDYLLGVEVGLDSNARKNRSGVILEGLVDAVVSSLSRSHREMRVLKQQTFQRAAEEFDVTCPPSMRDRRFDFAVLYEGRATNIEVNFYGGTGSKPSEIVNSYADRARLLREYGWKLIWVTDGPGWLRMRSPLRNGVEAIDYVLNYQMINDGLLSRILLEA